MADPVVGGHEWAVAGGGSCHNRSCFHIQEQEYL